MFFSPAADGSDVEAAPIEEVIEEPVVIPLDLILPVLLLGGAVWAGLASRKKRGPDD